jgi:hypothetical protein
MRSSWQANVTSASQEITQILWNPKIYYRIYKSPRPVPILNHSKLIRSFPSNILEIHFNIISPSIPKFFLTLRDCAFYLDGEYS